VSAQTSRPASPGDGTRAGIELNGLNTVAEAERTRA